LTLGGAPLKKEKKAPGEKLSALVSVPEDADSGIVFSSSASRKLLSTNLHRSIQRHFLRRYGHFKLSHRLLNLCRLVIKARSERVNLFSLSFGKTRSSCRE